MATDTKKKRKAKPKPRTREGVTGGLAHGAEEVGARVAENLNPFGLLGSDAIKEATKGGKGKAASAGKAGAKHAGASAGADLNPEHLATLIPGIGQALGLPGLAKQAGKDIVGAADWLGATNNGPPAKGKGKTTTHHTPPSTTPSTNTPAPQDPWTVLGNSLVKELQQAQQPVEAAISGQDTASSQQSAVNQALAVAGVTPNSSASQWLNSNIAQANANDQPMAAAMNAYGQAYGAGEKGVESALGQMGQANQLAMNTAPEQTWLTDLASHIQSNLSYSGEIPTSAATSLPPALLYYLQQSGAGPGSTAGVTPVANIKIPGFKQNTSGLPNQTAGAAGATNTNISGDSGAAPG